MLYRRNVLIRLIAGGLLLASGHKVSAEAANFSYTALITSQGKVLAQSPVWISYVNHAPRAGYFSDYKVVLKEGVFEGAPGFCAVSVVDVDSLDDVFYAQAKLSGTPTRHSVKVITHQIGSADPQANASKSFMLMCAK